jgi:4-amino-4-deoxy-L-arabinose transferase-like glycosyltransferase
VTMHSGSARDAGRSGIATGFTAALTGWRAYCVVACIALLASVPGIARMPVMDVDEARFAQASRQMLEDNDFVRIRLQDSERNRKPAGAYWLQAGATKLLAPIAERDNAIWTYRIPSVLGAILAAMATLWAGQALIGARPALLGAGLLAAGMLLGFEGMSARTDALMLGFTTLALAAAARLLVAPAARRPRLVALVFWMALAFSVLIKGPIPLAIIVLTLAAMALWERRLGWMAPLAWWPGPLVALALILPWGIAIGLATEGRFFASAFAEDLAPKLAGEDRGHAGFFGYHSLLLPLLMFPATLALPAAARLVFRELRARSETTALRFLMVWAGATLLMFELSPAKLLHYAMPAYPALALLCGAGLAAAFELRWRKTLAVGFWLFCAVGLVWAGFIGFGLREVGATDVAVAAGLCGMIIVVGAVALCAFRDAYSRVAAAIVCALALSATLRMEIIPKTDAFSVSARAASEVARIDGQAVRPLWVVGYDEPSIVFLTRTSARLASSSVAGPEIHEGDVVIVEAAELAPLSDAIAARGLVIAARAPPIAGISMSSNDRVSLIVGVAMSAQ